MLLVFAACLSTLLKIFILSAEFQWLGSSFSTVTVQRPDDCLTQDSQECQSGEVLWHRAQIEVHLRLTNDHQSIGAVGPSSRPLCASPDRCHNVDQNPHVPSARMDLPGSHLQELQPDRRCVANQTEATLTLEQSPACEYEIGCHKMLFVPRAQCLKWRFLHPLWLYKCRGSLFRRSQSEV